VDGASVASEVLLVTGGGSIDSCPVDSYSLTLYIVITKPSAGRLVRRVSS